MKQSVLILAATALFSIPVSAQLVSERHNFAVGINGGMNMASVSFNPKVKQNTLNGPSFGITLRYITEKYFSMICGVQIEINYSTRGWNEKIEDGTENYYKHSFKYVEVPFMAHLAFGKDSTTKGFQFFINAGPQFGYYLSDSVDKSADDTWDISLRPSTAQYYLEVDKKFEYGIAAGAGVEMNTKMGHFIMEGRYFYGLSDMFPNTKKDYFDRSANTYIGVRAAYLFDLKK